MRALSDYRADARTALEGNWNTSALFYFVYVLIVGVVNGIAVPFGYGSGSLLGTVLILPIAYGVVVAFLRLIRGENIQIEWLIDNFNRRIWISMFLQYLFILLWALLLVIPGIIKYYSYAMVPYILKDDPTAYGREALDRSAAMMKGHKMDLFLLDMSFLGWILLSMFTFGIGMMWVAPYMATANAAFYEDLKNEYHG